MKRKIQIGVMGSAADLNYSKELENLAEQIGFLIAKNNATLIFGAEKDYNSLSTTANRKKKKGGGMTVGVTYNRGLEIFEKENVDVIISTGLERGGGRETALILSCDGIITISGGSGTLTEIAIAYQSNIPIVAVKNTGGWSDKLSGQYLDERKRLKIEGVDTAEEAVKTIINLIKNKYEK